MPARCACACVILLLAAAAADAKEYSARRFDVVIRVLEQGALEVTETVVFQFEDGTFSFVYRDIPSRRTDGIEILSASIDGRELPFGDGPGRVEVTHKSRVRVRWRFEPVAHSTHTFVLRYIARGVVQRSDGADLLAWRALPREHGYRIVSSTIDLVLPAPPVAPPLVTSRRAPEPRVEQDAERLRIVANALRSNGSVELQVRFPSGAVIAQPPLWQQRQAHAATLAPRWIGAAAIVLALSLILLFALRQNYDAPPRDLPPSTAVGTLPDDLPPAVAGALATNGRPRLEHAMAALISLADRGGIAVTEEPPNVFGQRSFTVTRSRGAAALTGYEQVVVEAAFGTGDRLKEEVKLSAARTAIAHRLRRFARALEHHLLELGLMDEARRAVRNRYGVIALALLVLAGVAFAALITFARNVGPWPLAIAAALFVAAIVAGVFQYSTTALSNEGVRRANAWRAYRRHLRSAARDGEPLSEAPARLLPFAIAFGLAAAWAKYSTQISADVPAWFRAVSAGPQGFSAFIATGGAGASGGSGGSAGGGGSGAG